MRRVTSLSIVGVLPVVALAAGCGGNQTTASKSAAEFDAAQRKGVTPKAGEEHGGHGQADPVHSQAAGRATGASNMEEMDHSRIPGMANAPTARSAPAGTGSSMAGMDHSRMAGMGSARATRAAPGAAGSNMAGMDHSRMPGMGSAAGARPAPPRMDHSRMPGMDHSTMAGRPGMATAPPTPERPAVVAAPGQPATTLRPDEIDSPAPTAVREAARSAEMAMQMPGGGHGVQHGTYRQIDAGRDDVTPPPQSSHEGHQAAPPPPPSADPHQMHAAPAGPRPVPQTARPTPDPHGRHAAPASPKPAAKPSPRPTPSPRAKEDNR
jgi:hypothetical protein